MEFIYYFAAAILEQVQKLFAVFALLIGYYFAKQQFKFQSTHQRRMVIVEEAYEKIKMASTAYSFLNQPFRMNGEPTDEERGKDFVAKANEMVTFLDTKRLFFSDEEKGHIDAIKDLFRESWAEYIERRTISKNETLRDRKRELEIWKKNWKDADKEIPRLIKTLEDVFRRALGL